MIFLSALKAKIETHFELVDKTWKKFLDVEEALGRLRYEIRALSEKKRPTYVFLFSPATGVLAQIVHVSPDVKTTIRFPTYSEVPAGAIVSLIGENAVLDSVSVGNMAQLLCYADNPIAITRDVCPIGVYISVTVKGI